jgi:nicotinamidase/pyrazinamidase
MPSIPEPGEGDALVIVDVQKDFLPGGALGVADGSAVVPVLNGWIERFNAARQPVILTRDWHPPDHCSFADQGGIWPAHCVAESEGAAFADGLLVPEDALVVSKAVHTDQEAYSGFEGTGLSASLQDLGVSRLYIGGLATDYCVKATVEDACRAGYEVVVIEPGIRAVEVNPGDAARALAAMRSAGAELLAAG